MDEIRRVEAKVDECLLLLWGLENWKDSQIRLAGMRNVDSVNALLDAFRECPANELGRSRREWVISFEDLINELHRERERRNSLLHSKFLFDFMKSGHQALQIDRKARKQGKPDIELTATVQSEMLDRVVALYSRVAATHLQLVHDYGAPAESWTVAAT